MKTVELRPTFGFTCDECGTENHVFLMPAESPLMSDEERAELLERYDLEVGEIEGAFYLAPTEVTCGHCKTRFQTEAPSS